MSKYEYLLFDADGTLYDFHYAEENAIQETWTAYNIPLNDTTLKCFHKHNSLCWKQLEEGKIGYDVLPRKRFELTFNELGYSHIDPQKFNDDYLSNLSKHGKLFPQSLDVLKTLKSRGYRIFIVTNGIYSVQKHRFNQEETKGIYEKIFCSESLHANKPDPKFFEAVFKEIGLADISEEERRNKAIVIGDSLTSDIQGGINAKLNTIWYNPNNLPINEKIRPTFVIHQLKELLDYFPQL